MFITVKSNQFLTRFHLRLLNFRTKTTMSPWQEEKERILNLPLQERRKLYSCKDKYTQPKDIPTWYEYASKESLAKAIPAKPEYQINSALNVELSKKISMFKGDITTLEVDAIVNAANSSLLGGGGVDGAIHRAAGGLLLEECKTLRGCKTGEAKITGGYKLPAKYVIHTVGPQGEKPNFLQSCYRNCLDIMSNKFIRTIAFPCISTGIYGYPIEAASHIAIYEVRKHLEENADKVDQVIFCTFLPQDQKVFEGLLQSYFPLA